MSFASLWYFPFLCIIAAVYYVISARVKPYFLLAVSWLIYILFGLPHFLVLVFVTVVSYTFGLLIKSGGKRSTLILAVGVTVIVGLLFYLKYYDMFLSWISSAAGLLQRELTFSERYVILPAGISFYTFQSLSYMIDVYRGGTKERNFVKYALYISFFPQLVAGPIEQAGRLIPQLTGRRAAQEDFSVGIRYLLSGCIRKFVIADYMSGIVDSVYGNVMQQSGINLILATFFFAIQIYCDFSGYTHIAIGSARFLGIRLTENFDRPYMAAGCRDFWKRWHITLTKWFTEYVYIPLGGNRKGEWRKYLNIMIVFLLSGLWHGADLTFICWGAFFGIWRIAEEMIGKVKGAALKIWVKRAGTFILVCLSWVLFRSQNMAEAIEVLHRMFTLEGGCPAIAGVTELFPAAVRVGILALLPRLLKMDGPEEKEVVKSYYTVTVMVFLVTVSLLLMFDTGGSSSFIYFQF